MKLQAERMQCICDTKEEMMGANFMKSVMLAPDIFKGTFMDTQYALCIINKAPNKRLRNCRPTHPSN